jgi:hypothetical protein
MMRTLLAASVTVAILVIAATVPAAFASSVEGSISAIGTAEQTVTINKKVYRVPGSAKVLVSGKPGSFTSLKPGMTCKANIANGSQTTSLNCKGKGKDLLQTQLPVAEPATRPAGQTAGQASGRSAGQGVAPAR